MYSVWLQTQSRLPQSSNITDSSLCHPATRGPQPLPADQQVLSRVPVRQELLEARKVHLQTWRSWRRLAEGAWSWKTIDGSAEINFRSSSSECLSQSGGVHEFLCLFLVSMSVPVCVSGALFLKQSASRSCLIPKDGTELKMVETNIVEHGEH